MGDESPEDEHSSRTSTRQRERGASTRNAVPRRKTCHRRSLYIGNQVSSQTSPQLKKSMQWPAVMFHGGGCQPPSVPLVVCRKRWKLRGIFRLSSDVVSALPLRRRSMPQRGFGATRYARNFSCSFHLPLARPSNHKRASALALLSISTDSNSETRSTYRVPVFSPLKYARNTGFC